jgi:hypothetical protein
MEEQSSNRDSLRSLTSWLEEMGRKPITGWRWRNRGWLKTIVIANKHYVSDEAIANFRRRAETGEFAKIQTPPVHKRKSRETNETKNAS